MRWKIEVEGHNIIAAFRAALTALMEASPRAHDVIERLAQRPLMDVEPYDVMTQRLTRAAAIHVVGSAPDGSPFGCFVSSERLTWSDAEVYFDFVYWPEVLKGEVSIEHRWHHGEPMPDWVPDSDGWEPEARVS